MTTLEEIEHHCMAYPMGFSHDDLRPNPIFSIDFEVTYNLLPTPDDGEDDEEEFDIDAIVCRTIERTFEVEQDRLLGAAAEALIRDILDEMKVPPQNSIIATIADAARGMKAPPHKVLMMRVVIDAMVYEFPDEVYYEEGDVDFEDDGADCDQCDDVGMVADDDDDAEVERRCAICMGGIRVGSFETVLPCKHVFHRTCVERWLRARGNCPLCRAEFPSFDNSIGL